MIIKLWVWVLCRFHISYYRILEFGAAGSGNQVVVISWKYTLYSFHTFYIKHFWYFISGWHLLIASLHSMFIFFQTCNYKIVKTRWNKFTFFSTVDTMRPQFLVPLYLYSSLVTCQQLEEKLFHSTLVKASQLSCQAWRVSTVDSLLDCGIFCSASGTTNNQLACFKRD